MSDPDCCLKLNPDITGIGVRVALYVQILLGWAVSYYWPDTFAKNARTAYMTAIALLIAAFIQLTTQDLSLLDGIVVSLITTMMITFSISSSPTRANVQKQQSEQESDEAHEVDPNASFSRFLTQIIFVGFWAGWCLNMWKDPMHFGPGSPTCAVNEQVTITLFGREIHATDPRMQHAALALVSIGFVIAFLSLFISLESLLNPVINLIRKDDGTTRRRLDSQGRPEDRILKWVRRSLQALSLGTLIFLIVSTESTIKKNDREQSSNDWSYGQTIALILLLQQLMDVCSTYVEKKGEDKLGDSKQDLPMTPIPNLTTTMPSPQPAAALGPSPSPSPAPRSVTPNPQPAPGSNPAP
ncbi:hypothetical protein FRC12_002857 [Ceratobasidium sp. 428]|nr:hypothetical protein FRC09_015014 [Ceratobasidium sp. 395]KAG8772870.1 hypothetical protein FRC12_002857 [Ceratobasidium sp. 428]